MIKGDATPFVAEPQASVGTAGAADRIRQIRFQTFDGFDRVYVGSGRDDAAAGVPR